MTDRQFFTDTATGTLEYSGTDELTVDSSFDASEAETVTLDTKWEQFFDTNEFVQFEATVAQPIVQPYFHDGELQRFKKDESELKTAQAQLDNIEGTVTHPPEDRVTSADQIRGFWSDPEWSDGQDLTLNVPANDPEAVRAAVQKGDVSVGFSGTLDYTDDDTTAYDAVQRDITYDHVAFGLESGRCSSEDGCGLHTDSDVNQHGHVTDAVRTKQTEEGQYETDMNPTYSVGDWVSWDWSDGTATGRVDVVNTEESIMSSGARLDPQEEGEPVYGIDHWDESSGEFGNYKVAKESDLSSTSEPENFSDSGCAPFCSVGPCSCGAHDPFSDVEVNGEDIDLVPPESAQTAAQQALDARSDEDTEVNGMKSHGWNRAEQLASGEELSPSDIVGSTGAMAPWWSRHSEYSISGDSLKEPETDNPWEDNSYTAAKGWGGVSGYEWAIRKGNEIKRARGEEPTYSDSAQITKQSDTATDLTDTNTMDIKEFVDENDLSVEDVRYIVDSTDVSKEDLVDAPDEPTDFYDGEPNVETLADDFDAVDLLVDQKQTLENEVDSLQEDLRESRRPVFADKAETLAEMTHKWGDEDELMEKFDAEDEDERWTVDTLDEKIELVEDIAGEQTTTVQTDSASGTERQLVADNDGTVSESDIGTTQGGKFDLRNKR